MRIGIDTYSYHRLLGWRRAGEEPAERRLENAGPAAVAQARALGCEVVSLQTSFLGSPAALDVPALRDACGPMEAILAWGHPEGLAFGHAPTALADLLAWIDAASALGGRMARIVVGGPALRGAEPEEDQISRTAPLVRLAAQRAEDRGLRLAIENHADLDSAQLIELIERAECANVGVCFDTANAARLGERPVEAARRLKPQLAMMHLKDTEAPGSAEDSIAGPCSVPYGEGVIPITELLATLAEPIASGCPVCVEIGQIAPGVDERELAQRCVRWLQAWRSRAPAAEAPATSDHTTT